MTCTRSLLWTRQLYSLCHFSKCGLRTPWTHGARGGVLTSECQSCQCPCCADVTEKQPDSCRGGHSPLWFKCRPQPSNLLLGAYTCAVCAQELAHIMNQLLAHISMSQCTQASAHTIHISWHTNESVHTHITMHHTYESVHTSITMHYANVSCIQHTYEPVHTYISMCHAHMQAGAQRMCESVHTSITMHTAHV
jgi:hypothetical protein